MLEKGERPSWRLDPLQRHEDVVKHVVGDLPEVKHRDKASTELLSAFFRVIRRLYFRALVEAKLVPATGKDRRCFRCVFYQA